MVADGQMRTVPVPRRENDGLMPSRADAARLFFLFLDFHGFKVFRLEDLSAIETFHVIDSISPGDNLGASVLTSGLHNDA
jgi:hypothetical protein